MNTLEFSKAYNRDHRNRVGDYSYAPDSYNELDCYLGNQLLKMMELNGGKDTLLDDEVLSEIEEGNRLYNRLYSGLYATNSLAKQNPDSMFVTPEMTSVSDERLLAATRTYSLAMYDAMYPGWMEMAYAGEFSLAQRDEAIRTGQLVLASQCLRLALLRSRHTGIAEDYRYFSDDLRKTRSVINGIMNEYDTAIVLLELSRADPDLMVVNAPLRFESWAGSANSDFIAYHKEADSVIGVQAKSGNTSDSGRYDSHRVMMVDGADDLKGHAMHRVYPGSSHLRNVTWPGLVASEVISAMPLHGPFSATQNNTGFPPKSFLNLRRIAHDTLRLKYGSGNRVSGTLQYAKKAVGDKLYEKLGADRPARALLDRPTRKKRR